MSSAGRRHYSIMSNTAWFLSSMGIVHGLTNPDRINFLEVMPIYRQRYYGIITKFDVSYTNHKDFEFFTKDTIRYYQNHQGYLFSNLLRSRSHSTSTIHYYLVQTWATMSAFKVAFDAPYRQQLTRCSKATNPYVPQVMKIVADDFEFVPLATTKNPALERQGIRKALNVSSMEQKAPSYTANKFGTKW